MSCSDIEVSIGKIFINDVVREDVQLRKKKFILFVSERRGTNNVTELGQISFMLFLHQVFSAAAYLLLDSIFGTKKSWVAILILPRHKVGEQRKHCSGSNNMCMQILTQTKNRTMTSFGLL